MSKFDWVDKDSTKWFILLPSGHVGPYSFTQVIELHHRRKIELDVKIWAEGMNNPAALEEILQQQRKSVYIEDFFEEVEEEDPPPIPKNQILNTEPVKKTSKIDLSQIVPVFLWTFILLIFSTATFLFVSSLSSNKKFYIARLDKMTPEIHQRVLNENSFSGWSKEIFFREYISEDYSRIWLISPSYHRCEIEATFTSLEGKLLSLDAKKIIFKAQGKLSNHSVNLSSFQFSKGDRILPGMYEMDIRAFDCEWEGIIPLVMNGLTPPEDEYLGRTKVIMHSKGVEEFKIAFENLLKKKQTLERKSEVTKTREHNLFQENLIQKFTTLGAVSNQIEQHFLNFLSNDPKDIRKKMDVMINTYSKKFGYFLTSFVIENENDFKNISTDQTFRNNEELIRLTSKKIGFESMKFIEEIQKIKKTPSKNELKKLIEKIQKTFSSMRKEINQKLSRVSQNPKTS